MTGDSASEVLARAVLARRVELGLEVEEAAARANVPVKSWRVVEQGTTNPSPLMIGAVCRALEWSPATIDGLLHGDLEVDEEGEVVVDLDVAPPVPISSERVVAAPATLDTEGLTREQLAEVQDFIDELRGDRDD